MNQVSAGAFGFRVFTFGAGTLCAVNDLGIINTNLTLPGAIDAVGAAVANLGNLTLYQCDITGNTAATSGGALWNAGTLVVDKCILLTNKANNGNGGAIWSTDGSFSVRLSTLSGNSATNAGGAIATATRGTIDRTKITACTAAIGGAVYAASSGGIGVVVTYSTIGNDNSATTAGGGVYVGTGLFDLDNSTVAQNTVGEPMRLAALGGGVYVSSGATLNAYSATIAFNNAPTGAGSTGGGIYIDTGGTVNMANTIVSDNFAPNAPDIGGTVTSFGHNLIGNTQGGAGFVASDLQNVPSGLSMLAPNGGPTWTCALSTASVAIDAGDNSYAIGQWDQRYTGFYRIVGPTIDIGAYELQAGGGFASMAFSSKGLGSQLIDASVVPGGKKAWWLTEPLGLPTLHGTNVL